MNLSLPLPFWFPSQEEYLEALNKQEIAKRELDGITKQKEEVAKEVKTLQADVDKINKIYKEQDELLGENSFCYFVFVLTYFILKKDWTGLKCSVSSFLFDVRGLRIKGIFE